MKVRIEIFEDDGTEKANAQFNGKLWKEYVINFIHSVDDTELPTTEPSSEIPSQQQAHQNIQTAPPMQQQVPPNPQLQNYPYPPNPNPNPIMQQPYYYYPQPLQYPPQFQAPPPVYHHPLQQAVFPNNQPPQPQQYAAQPVAPLQPQVQTPLQSQTYQPQASLRDKINDTSLTISERLELFLKYEYPHVWFTSQEIQKHYERVYGFIKLSTVSTYLSRMYRKNLLQRRGNRTQREYMYICDELDIQHADAITAPVANGIMQ